MTTLPGRFWKGSSLGMGVRTVVGEREDLMKSRFLVWEKWLRLSDY